jgi:hypothetical protein
VKLTKHVEYPEKMMQPFEKMQQEGMIAAKFTFVQVINACADLGALENSRLVHAHPMWLSV